MDQQILCADMKASVPPETLPPERTTSSVYLHHSPCQGLLGDLQRLSVVSHQGQESDGKSVFELALLAGCRYTCVCKPFIDPGHTLEEPPGQIPPPICTPSQMLCTVL